MHAVAQLVEALRYKSEGCGFDSHDTLLVQFTLSTYLAVLTETQTCKIYAVLLVLYCVFMWLHYITYY
jgi:hypothetical protein